MGLLVNPTFHHPIMKTFTKSLVFAGALTAAFAINVVRASVEIGKPAPDFTLTDIAGKAHKLSDYKGKVIVLEWTNSGCPLVQKHYNSGNMQKTQRAAAADGAVWLQINSGHPGAQGDLSNEEAAAWLKKKGAKVTASFRDQSGKVGRMYGAQTTPHMYVINQDGTLVYNGAIDSIPSADQADIAKATNYVLAALEAVKAGKPVEKAATKPYGCNVKYGKAT
jgi:peroxiredoxin